MTLDELFSAINHLNDEEFKALQDYIEQKRRENWAKAFDEAVQALHEGLSKEEVEEIVRAINTEYIEPVNEEQWRD
jgi:hypothetical protein